MRQHSDITTPVISEGNGLFLKSSLTEMNQTPPPYDCPRCSRVVVDVETKGKPFNDLSGPSQIVLLMIISWKNKTKTVTNDETLWFMGMVLIRSSQSSRQAENKISRLKRMRKLKAIDSGTVSKGLSKSKTRSLAHRPEESDIFQQCVKHNSCNYCKWNSGIFWTDLVYTTNFYLTVG